MFVYILKIGIFELLNIIKILHWLFLHRVTDIYSMLRAVNYKIEYK